MSKLDGKRVLITGGAQGIGLEMAMKFAERGSEVIVADIDDEKLVDARAKLERGGARVWCFHVDVTNPTSIASLKSQIATEAGPVDILVNNAGIVFGGTFTETPLDEHFKTYEVNVMGLVAMTHAFLPDLIARPEAHLVHISSASGFVGVPYMATYASSKWAVIGFGESIRAELNLLGHEHVQHTIVCPSYIKTGLFEGAEAPKATSLLDPDYIAEKIVDAVERNKLHLVEPFMAKLTPILRDILPTSLFDSIWHLFGGDTSMARWTGREKDSAQSQSESEDQAASKDQPEAER